MNATFPLCTDTNENITLPTSFSGVKCKIIEQSKHFRDKKKIKPKTGYDEYKMFLETYKTVNVKEVVRTTFAHLNLFTLKKQLRKKELVTDLQLVRCPYCQSGDVHVVCITICFETMVLVRLFTQH